MRNILGLKTLTRFLQAPQGRFFIVAGTFAAFFVVFFLFYPKLGLPITTLGVIPVLVGAWVFGMWSGIAFTITLYIVDILIILLMGWGDLQIAFLPNGLLGLATSATASLIIGRLGENEQKRRQEYLQHKVILEQQDASARFLRLLNDILLAAMETDDMSSMLNVLAIRTGELFRADNCYITFWDEKNRRTIAMAAHGPSSLSFLEAVGRLGPDARTITSIVMDAGHTIAIDDTHGVLSPLSNSLAENYASRSLLGLPLISGERDLGAVILAYNDFHHFAAEEIEHGELAARQISLAVTKAKLLGEAQHSVHELTGLHDISQAFSLHGEAKRTYGLLAETVGRLMGARVCVIGRYNHSTFELQPQFPVYGLDDKELPSLSYNPEAGHNSWNFAVTGSFRANSEAEIPPAYLDQARAYGIENMLISPLWDSEVLQGVVFVANKPGGFNDDDIRLLDVFTAQVTVVIQNFHLLNTERTLAEKLGVLYTIAIATTQAANEDQLIEHVTHIIGQRLYSDSFGILLLDETANELYLHSSYRIGSHEGLTRVPLGIGVAGSVARSGKPHRVDDVSTSPIYLSLYPLTRSELCVPLKVEDKLLGVVNAESTRVGAFTTEDEEMLTIIAGQLATAIQRLRTVLAEHFQTQQLERSNSLIRALAQVNTRAATASDLNGVLKTLGVELNKLGLRCAVALQDSTGEHLLLSYISLPAKLMDGMERIGKVKLSNFSIPAARLYAQSETPPRACLVMDPLAMIMSWIPDFPGKTARKILKLIGVTDTTSICDLPLITEGKSMGTMWMWGEGVHEADLPTVSLFASQVAAALQKANLLTEVGRLAVTDELTGIFNRRHFFQMAEKQFNLSQRDGRPLTALIVDLDHFKQFNDSYGHVVGDQVLRETARLMSMAMRDTDIIGRYGGEEFSILLPETSTRAAVYVAERLISIVSDTKIDTEAGPMSVQLSIGVAGRSDETPTLQALIIRADQAMYLAKSAGRNCVVVK